MSAGSWWARGGGEALCPLVTGEAGFARGGGHVCRIGRQPERAGAEKGGTPFDGRLTGHAHRQDPDQAALVVREQFVQEALLDEGRKTLNAQRSTLKWRGE